MAAKYAPANEEGKKPFVVTLSDWGRYREKVVYADTAAEAKWSAWGRLGTGQYVTKVRRALVEEIKEGAS